MLGPARLLLGVAWWAAAAACTSAALVWWDADAPTRLAPGAAAIARLAPIGLVAVSACLLLVRERLRSAAALVASAGGQAWLLAWSGAPSDHVRSAALYVSALLLPGLGVLVGGRRLVVGWAAIATTGVVWAAIYDPFLDVGCSTFCSRNVLVVSAQPSTAPHVADVMFAAALALAAAGAVWAAVERTAVPAIGGTAVAMMAAGFLLGSPASGPASIASVGVVTLGVLSVAPVEAAIRRTVRLGRLRRLANVVAAGDGAGWEAALAGAVGDPELRVLYPAQDGTLLDGAGRPQALRADRAATELTVGDRAVAVVEHHPAIDGRDLRLRFGPAARMGAWNAALAAELRHRLADVTASRRRLVEATDGERRRIERDLHDGAQQGLLAAAFELRRVRAAAAEPAATAVIDRGVDVVQRVLGELRAMAADVHPVVLDDTELDAALYSLAERSTRPMEIHAPATRLDAVVSRTVYDIVAAALRTGATTSARVTAAVDDSMVVVAVDDPGGAMPQDVADRIDALGGRVRSSETVWEVSIPCGW